MCLNHLVFANDLFVFCGANEASVREVMTILHHFEKFSRLKVNEQKSQVFFGGVTMDEKNRIL